MDLGKRPAILALGAAGVASALSSAVAHLWWARHPLSPDQQRGEGFEVAEEELSQPGGAAAWIERQAQAHGDLPLASTSLARLLDGRDRLRRFRAHFSFPRRDPDTPDGCSHPSLYFVGNSLGLQPRSVKDEVELHLHAWADRGVEGHFTGAQPWMPIEDTTNGLMASIVGALPSEVVCMNSLTVNLHLGMATFYRPTPTRYKILVEKRCFPSDDYAVQSQVALHGRAAEEALIYVERRPGAEHWTAEDIEEVLAREGASIALVLLGGVQYLTGQFFEIERITAAAHARGCKVGWDLAHAVGNVPLALHDWNVDFACWCTYKYLNAGPGNIGGFFVHARHCEAQPPPVRLAGWWGHRREDRFAMDTHFAPTPTAHGFQLSNPPVLCMAALLASLRVFDEAGGMPAIRLKSLVLTGYLELLLRVSGLSPARVQVLTPEQPSQRGAQLSLRFDCEVDVLEKLLRARGVMVDTRKPDVMRVAPAPLYNSFEDVCDFVKELASVVAVTPPTAGWLSLQA